MLAQRIPALSRSRLKALILDGQVTIGGRTIRDPGPTSKQATWSASRCRRRKPCRAARPSRSTSSTRTTSSSSSTSRKTWWCIRPPASSGTLVNALIAHCGDSLSGIGGVKRPGIVHRLDKDTTGLMVVAKNDRAHRHLSKQFADKLESGLQRGYLAVVWGAPDRAKGTIDAPLDRSAINREKQAVREGGRDAITHWEMRERYVATEGKDGKCRSPA